MADLSLDDLIQSASRVRISTTNGSITSGSSGSTNVFARRVIIDNATPEEKRDYKANVLSLAQPLVFEGCREDLEAWEGWVPSECSVVDGTRLVRINRPGSRKVDLEPVNEEMLEDLDEEFRGLQDNEVTALKIRDLATKFGFVSGKWMIFSNWNEIDELWQMLVKALLDGRLPGVLYLKVSARDDRPENKNDQKVAKISVVNSYFTDTAEVLKVAKDLRSLGVRGVLKYKADIYTRLNIFTRNKYNILPTLFTDPPDAWSTSRGRGRGRARGGRRV